MTNTPATTPAVEVLDAEPVLLGTMSYRVGASVDLDLSLVQHDVPAPRRPERSSELPVTSS